MRAVTVGEGAGYGPAHGGGVQRVTQAADDLWNVIVLGFDAPEPIVVEGLQRLFGVDEVTALRLARSTPRAVKHDVPRDLAEQYAVALSSIGGRYELQASADAFLETSAGEHVSPVARRAPRAVVPDHLEAPDQIGSEFGLEGDAAGSGLEIDTVYAQRAVHQGNQDPWAKKVEIARAGMSSFPPAASQSLPPPRMTYSLPPAAEPEPDDRSGLHVVLGIALIVAGVLGARTVLKGELAIVDPVLKAVGALLLARGIWLKLSK